MKKLIILTLLLSGCAIQDTQQRCPYIRLVQEYKLLSFFDEGCELVGWVDESGAIRSNPSKNKPTEQVQVEFGKVIKKISEVVK